MASRARKTFWILASNYALILLNVITGIVLVPLYLKHLGVASYGAWLATGEVLGWLMVADPGLGAILQQRVAAAFGRRDLAEVGNVAGSGYCVMAVIAAAIAAVGWSITDKIPAWLSLPSEVNSEQFLAAYQVALAGLTLHFLSYPSSAVGSGLQQAHTLGGIGVAATAGSVIVTLVGILQGYGLLALAYGALFRGGAQFLGHPIVVYRAGRDAGIRFRVTRDGIRSLLGISVYNALSQWGSLLAGRVDSIVLTRMVGPEAAASVALTRRGPVLLQLVAERPSYSAMPLLSELQGAGEIARARRIAIRLLEISFWILGGGFGGFLGLNGAFMHLWVGSALFPGQLANALVCIAVVLRVGSLSFANYCLALGNIRGNALARFTEAVAYIGLVFVGARLYGVMGLIVADVAAVLCVSVWYYPRAWVRLARAERLEVLGLARELGVALAAGAVTAGLVSMLEVSSWPSFLLAGLAAVALYVVALWSCSARVRDSLRAMLRRALARGTTG